MKQFKDRPLIIEALRESKELIEVNEDGTSIRRKAPVNSTRNYNEYSLYVVILSFLKQSDYMGGGV